MSFYNYNSIYTETYSLNTQHSIHFTFSKRFQRSAFEIESDDRYLYRRTVQLYEIFLLMSLAASTVGFVVV